MKKKNVQAPVSRQKRRELTTKKSSVKAPPRKNPPKGR
jgi:hypothetical protein